MSMPLLSTVATLQGAMINVISRRRGQNGKRNQEPSNGWGGGGESYQPKLNRFHQISIVLSWSCVTFLLLCSVAQQGVLRELQPTPPPLLGKEGTKGERDKKRSFQEGSARKHGISLRVKCAVVQTEKTHIFAKCLIPSAEVKSGAVNLFHCIITEYQLISITL